MRVLLTGHKGYIGRSLFKELCIKGYDVTGIDLKDGRDIIGCLPERKFDCVFHMAALPSVQFSVEKPSYCLRNNVYCTSVLLEWSKNNNVKKFIFSSSAAANNAISPYGLQKKMCEMECKLYSDLYGLQTVSLRYHNVYSEDQPYGGSYSTVISSWMEMIRKGKTLTIDGDGEQTRDFIHVSDIIAANLSALKTTNKLCGDVVNVGTGNPVSLNYIKKHIDDNFTVEWNYRPMRNADIKHSLADVTQAKKLLDWEPKVFIEEGLQLCFNKVN